MAFKRTSGKSLTKTNNPRFSTAYKFSKKANFDVGKDAYIIILGLESGFFETPCHRILPHKVNGKLIGFKNTTFATYIKCKGVDEEGNRTESLCCTLAQLEKERIPEKEESGKRIVTFTNYRVHLPVLILGNSLNDKKKGSYPITKVSILNDLRSEEGLNFSYLEMASSSFNQDIINAYGKKLKEEGIIDYELEEGTEEYIDEVLKRLPNTVVKVHGYAKQGFDAALKEYSFFPFENATIANASPAGEREAIIGYKDNEEIQNKICEFLDLFNIEVDNMFNDWTEKELQEYYNSAIGADLKAPIAQPKAPAKEQEEVEATEEVEVVEEEPEVPKEDEVKVEVNKPVSDEDLEALLNPETVEKEVKKGEPKTSEALDEFDIEGDDDFFSEE